ncbi:kinase-like domain-containing protein [Cerioporus squamosus]|nr:kinase-like domain-containing protein [Cerioporus squamosus]
MSASSSRLPHYAYVSPEAAARHAKDTAEGFYDLLPAEVYWRDRYFFLAEHGYTLRPRYHPKWTPSWTGTNMDPMFCEDSISLITPRVIDATSRSDNQLVAIKTTRNDTRELHIARFLSEKHAPENHCVPVLDILQDPSEPHTALLIMPYLRSFNDPDFGTIGEVMEFIYQTLEGLAFLHEQRVAHRDIGAANVMMDGRAMYPDGHHPIRTDYSPDGAHEVRPLPRSNCDVRYYFIDFGLSSQFREGESPMVLGRAGRDKEIPELSSEVPYDAYRADVFALGNLYYKEFVSRYHGLDLINPLINMMKWRNPAQRPSADSAKRIFHSIYSRMDEAQLRWRLRSRKESTSERVVYDTVAVAREGIYQLKRLIS